MHFICHNSLLHISQCTFPIQYLLVPYALLCILYSATPHSSAPHPLHHTVHFVVPSPHPRFWMTFCLLLVLLSLTHMQCCTFSILYPFILYTILYIPYSTPLVLYAMPFIPCFYSHLPCCAFPMPQSSFHLQICTLLIPQSLITVALLYIPYFTIYCFILYTISSCMSYCMFPILNVSFCIPCCTFLFPLLIPYTMLYNPFCHWLK